MNLAEIIQKKPWVAWVLFFVTLVLVFLVGLLGASIVERRTEAQLTGVQFQPIPEFEPRNAVWGEQFPRQFQIYMITPGARTPTWHQAPE